MVVSLKKHALDWFRRKARDNPNEIIAFLVGKRTSLHKVRVEHIVYPELAISTPTEVCPILGESESIAEHYADEGLQIIGDIHTHPNAPPLMSQQDFEAHKECGYIVSGIVGVSGRRTWVSFWQLDSALSCGWEYHS